MQAFLNECEKIQEGKKKTSANLLRMRKVNSSQTGWWVIPERFERIPGDLREFRRENNRNCTLKERIKPQSCRKKRPSKTSNTGMKIRVLLSVGSKWEYCAYRRFHILDDVSKISYKGYLFSYDFLTKILISKSEKYFYWLNLSSCLKFPSVQDQGRPTSNGRGVRVGLLLFLVQADSCTRASCRKRVECGKGNWLRMSSAIVIYKYFNSLCVSFLSLINIQITDIFDFTYCDKTKI